MPQGRFALEEFLDRHQVDPFQTVPPALIHRDAALGRRESAQRSRFARVTPFVAGHRYGVGLSEPFAHLTGHVQPASTVELRDDLTIDETVSRDGIEQLSFTSFDVADDQCRLPGKLVEISRAACSANMDTLADTVGFCQCLN